MKMRMTAPAAGIMLVLAISACGGGGSNSTTATPAPRVTPAKTHITIYLAGDSTNWGVDIDDAATNPQQAPGVGNGVVGRANPAPAQLMQAGFDKALGPGIVTIIDGSIPGATLPSDLNGTAPSISPLATRLAQLSAPPDIVITNSEINDQYVLKETPDQYGSWLLQWMQTVKATGAIPVFEEPNPICEAGFDIPMTDEFVATERQFAAEQGITLLPTYDAYKLYPLWNLTSGLMSSDCVHPNEAGYAFKEANYFPALLPVVKKLLGG